MALIAGQLGLGGAEQQLYYLVCGLSRSAFEPLVITLGPRAAEHWAQPIARAGVRVVHVPRASGRAARVLRIAAILRRARVDVVHGWAFHANFYAAAAGRLSRVPVRIGSMRESYAGLPANRMWRWAGVRGVAPLITNSRVNADSLPNYMRAPSRVCVVPNGITLPIEQGADARAALRRQLGITPEDLVIGTVGRLDRNKNQMVLLRAFVRLQHTHPRLHVVIIGDGPLRGELQSEAVRLGIGERVHFPGVITDAARYLAAFDVCCLTSDTEGMPNVVMEASAARVPVVSTDCGGSRELIDHGTTGYLVRCGDDEALAVHAGELLQSPDLAQRLGDAGRTKMRREFSVESMVARMSDVYYAELARHASVHGYAGSA